MIDGLDESYVIDHIYWCVNHLYNLGQAPKDLTKAAIDLLDEYF